MGLLASLRPEAFVAPAGVTPATLSCSRPTRAIIGSATLRAA